MKNVDIWLTSLKKKVTESSQGILTFQLKFLISPKLSDIASKINSASKKLVQSH